MNRYKMQQRQFSYRGKVFHFVSYEGEAPDASKLQVGTPPTWFLMTAGKRWPVMTEEPGMPMDELDRLLKQWLDTNVFSQTPREA